MSLTSRTFLEEMARGDAIIAARAKALEEQR